MDCGVSLHRRFKCKYRAFERIDFNYNQARSFVHSTLITAIDSSQPEADDKVTRRSSATDFANPTFTRWCRKTSKKFPATPSLSSDHPTLSPPQCFPAEELCALCPRAFSRGHSVVNPYVAPSQSFDFLKLTIYRFRQELLAENSEMLDNSVQR